MKINDKKIDCFLCNQTGKMSMIRIDKKTNKKYYYSASCPLCEEKGYLLIINRDKH